MRWLMPDRDTEEIQKTSQAFAKALKISSLTASVLLQRGISDPQIAHRFLHPNIDQLHSPWQMRGMESAVGRIAQAIDRREKVFIYGDYDVDGAMAVVVLQTALQMIGANVQSFIPDRFRDGYGMREEVVEEAARNGFSLLISVDTGIRAFAVVERAREAGLDCIITDHHLPEKEANGVESIPRAHAVLNPKQPGCEYPEKNLSGVGVAFKLVQALLEKQPADAARTKRLIPSFLKLVCIGTIADNVPLTGENRVIARIGLDELRYPSHPGLKALLDAAGLAGRAVSSWDVGFRIAPRLNAAGRMESAEEVIELLTVAGPERALELASKLSRLNTERQATEQRILEEVEARYRERPEDFSGYCLVVDGEGWHQGVLGIIASRLLERFGSAAALVISRNGETGQGSGRSIQKFHLLDALTACGQVFNRFGGHSQAAGFQLSSDRIDELRKGLCKYAAKRLTPEDLVPELKIDTEVALASISLDAIDELMLLGPHGFGNPRTVFCARDVRLAGQPIVLKDKHLKLQISEGTRNISAIFWRNAGLIKEIEQSSCLDIAFHADRNEYAGQSSLQLELLDVKQHEVKRQ